MCCNEKDKFLKVYLVFYVCWNYNCKKKISLFVWYIDNDW